MRGLILVLTSNELLGRIFHYLSGHFVVTACYWWLLVVTTRYRTLLLVPNFSISACLTYQVQIKQE